MSELMLRVRERTDNLGSALQGREEKFVGKGTSSRKSRRRTTVGHSAVANWIRRSSGTFKIPTPACSFSPPVFPFKALQNQPCGWWRRISSLYVRRAVGNHRVYPYSVRSSSYANRQSLASSCSAQFDIRRGGSHREGIAAASSKVKQRSTGTDQPNSVPAKKRSRFDEAQLVATGQTSFPGSKSHKSLRSLACLVPAQVLMSQKQPFRDRATLPCLPTLSTSWTNSRCCPVENTRQEFCLPC